jgi:hypothetical protein
VTTAARTAGIVKSSTGTRIACQFSGRATGFWAVRAAPVVSTAKTIAALETPVTHASARDARTPERAAKITVNAANARGARERAKDAAVPSIPVAARYSGGRVTASGTRFPSCHRATPAGQIALQSAAPPKPNTHSSVRGARVAARPTATARMASTAASRATMMRFMRHRPYFDTASAPR